MKKCLAIMIMFNALVSVVVATKPDEATKLAVTDEAGVTYNVLADDIKRKGRFTKYVSQTFNSSASIAATDKDPLDVILRRTRALLDDIKSMKKAPKLKQQEKALADLEAKAGKTAVSDAQLRKDLFNEVHTLRREIAFKNPLLDFDKILFIKRQRSKFNHMCDQYYGNFAVPGGGVFVLSNPFSDKPEEKNILADSVVETGRLKGTKLDVGGFLSPELTYDGKTIHFAYVECTGSTKHIDHLDHKNNGHWGRGRSYHLFKVNVDPSTVLRTGGTGLKQLTDGTFNDFDPCPLPNGRVMFISERRGGYLRCGRECPTYTVYDMKSDGSDIRMLSPHETNEWHPSVTHDGMIIYTRWDYVDRHGCTAHHPWVMTPDGRDSRSMHGNYSIRGKRPDMELDLRAVPGSHKFTATAAPHHGQSYGSLIMVDPRDDDDDAMSPVKRITPDVAFPESQGGKQVYGTPWPLSENYYLCVYDSMMRKGGKGRQGAKHRPGNYGIYLVDAFGNKVLVYRDPAGASLSPIPLRPRKKPPVVPCASDRLAEKPSEQGTMAVLNVYDSLLPFPKDTKITALRLYQILPLSVSSKAVSHNIGIQIPQAQDSINLARKILGTVPVEADASAYFVVPAMKEIYFQALNEDGLAVQSMRSSTWVQPGERLVCAGCHEPRNRAAIQPKKTALALKRAASIPKPDVDGTNPFSYPRLVQPVLDKKCVTCHKKEKKAPRLDSEPMVHKTRGWMNKPTTYYASYITLAPKFGFYNYGSKSWGSPKFYRTTPGEFGAQASKLYKMLKAGHLSSSDSETTPGKARVKLTKEEMHRITVWLDSVSNFYGVYEKEGAAAQLRGEIAQPTLE